MNQFQKVKAVMEIIGKERLDLKPQVMPVWNELLAEHESEEVTPELVAETLLKKSPEKPDYCRPRGSKSK
jgi:hypothetical protein